MSSGRDRSITRVNVQVGAGFPMLLLLTFIILKLTKTIDWSWWWVLSPLWIPLGLVAVVVVVALIMWIATGQYKR